MNNRPPVSICLLTYNRAALLPATLDSLLAQSFGDFELIIADDCSVDTTEEICQKFAQEDPRIRYLRNKENLGMPGNLNSALESATGCYLANVHDGDIYRSDLITKWVGALDTYPTAGFVFNAYRSFGKGGREIIFKESYPPLIEGQELGRRLLSSWSSCVFGTVMARRETYDRVGWFDPRFGNFSDVDMWLRMARYFDVAYVNEPIMDLMPKDPTRFYAFVQWQVLFWLMGIHTTNLRRYESVLPDITRELASKYFWRRRNYLLYNMLICVKHHRWDRVREGLAIWRDSDDRALSFLGKFLGNPSQAPVWYSPTYWKMARLSIPTSFQDKNVPG